MSAWLVRLARARLTRGLVGYFCAYLSFLLPVKRLYNSATLLAFPHPQPAYPIHLLLVPKKALSGLENLAEDDAALLVEVFQAAASLAGALDLPGYRLVLNGGAYQDVPQLHFHLISGE